jgi:hypothetical protein
MEQMGPERLLMMAAVPVAHDQEIDRYLRWEYPGGDATWAHGRLLAASAAPVKASGRMSLLARLGRLFGGRFTAQSRLARPAAR